MLPIKLCIRINSKTKIEKGDYFLKLEDFYKQVGGDYDSVSSRLLGDNMIKKFVLKFPLDPSYNDLKNAISNNNIQAAFSAAHTLKGTAANLGFDHLAICASILTEELRNADKMPNNDIIKAVDSAYEITITNIKLLNTI